MLHPDRWWFLADLARHIGVSPSNLHGGHRQVFRWNGGTDTFEPMGELHHPGELRRYMTFIQNLVEAGEVEMEAVRYKVVEFYRFTG